MGQNLSNKKCSNCKKKADYEKIIYSDLLPICTCNYYIIPKSNPFRLKENVIIYNNCTCNRSIVYDSYVKKLLSENRDILEFLKEIPKDDYRDLITNEKMCNQFKCYFYACKECIIYRPWSLYKMNLIDINPISK